MGLFKTRFKVCSVFELDLCREVEGWVDPNFFYTIVPKCVLEELGIKAFGEMEFDLGMYGGRAKRRYGGAIIKLRVGGEELYTYVGVIFGEDCDVVVLGDNVLEHLGLRVDFENRRFVRGEIYLCSYLV